MDPTIRLEETLRVYGDLASWERRQTEDPSHRQTTDSFLAWALQNVRPDAKSMAEYDAARVMLDDPKWTRMRALRWAMRNLNPLAEDHELARLIRQILAENKLLRVEFVWRGPQARPHWFSPSWRAPDAANVALRPVDIRKEVAS